MISGMLRDYTDPLGKFTTSSESSLSTQFSGISIDSRTAANGNMFVCIVGENHDGHEFIGDAVARGANPIIVNRSNGVDYTKFPEARFIAVESTFITLQELAQEYLKKINPRKVAVTGTNGKTTSKNLIAAVLASKYRTNYTKGNFNNQFGVPLSIFEFDENCEVAVFEFAMTQPGNISRLVELVDPDIRVILNVGPAHLETMKSIEAIAEAKFEILQNAKATDWAVLNMDDANIRSRSYRYRMNKLTFGLSTEFDIHPERVFANGSGRAHLIYQGDEITLPILGSHHVTNALSAFAVAKVMEVPFAEVKRSIEAYIPTGNRMTTLDINGVTVINDAYNSNPISVAGALETLNAIKVDGKKIVVLGDMKELGEKAEEYHAQIGKKAAGVNPDKLILIGEYAKVIAEAAQQAGLSVAKISILTDHDQIIDALSKTLTRGDLLLLKASRAMQLEKVEQGLKAILGRRN